MSGIFGIFNRKGKSIEKNTVNTMLDAMSYWNPDDSGTWIDGPAALGHTMLWNTPESTLENLPNKQNSHIITMDARLDNRQELAEKLEIVDRPINQITDSDFILSAYDKWGESCPKYLLGDFAFAIWDEKKQQMFCARDHIGIKPFYYHLDDELFLFANDIKGILSYPDILKSYNDQKEFYILDTRNDYEIRVGTFDGATILDLQHFRDFPRACETQLSSDIKDKPKPNFEV